MPVEVKCAWCGKPKQVKPNYARKYNNIFCNQECRGKWMSKYHRGENHVRWEGLTVECANCDKELRRWRSRIENTERQFCDMQCQGEWQSQNIRGENHPLYGKPGLRGDKNPTWKGDSIAVCCAWCNTEIHLRPYRIRGQKRFFCSRKCEGKWKSVNGAGPNNPHWKGGSVTYYGPNWQAQRHKARKRDNYTCQNCDITEEEYWRELDVHHITPFREFGYIFGENDYYKKANRLSNLICYCQACHLAAEYGNTPTQD